MYNLLIADDEQLERDAIQFLINKRNLPFKVYKAKNGKEALTVFEKINFDFIILDIKMPLIDGIEVGKQIREKNKEIPIVYLTAWSSFDFAKSAISIRALDYLVKPINKKDLYKVLNSFIEKKEIENSLKHEEFKTVVNQFSKSFFASMKHGLLEDDILYKYFNLSRHDYFEGVSLIVNEVQIKKLKQFFEQEGFINNRFYYFPSTDRSTIIVFFKNKSKLFKCLQNNAKEDNLFTPSKFTIAISTVFSDINELPRAIKEASIAYNIAKGNRESIHEYNHIDENIIQNSNINYVDEIEKSIFDLDLIKAREIAHKLYDSLSYLDNDSLLENYYQNVLILHHILSKKIVFFRLDKPIKTIYDTEVSLFNMIESSIQALKEDKKDKYKRIFREISNEINVNYNKQLTMDYYSNLLEMNTKYFSKLFKSYNEISFIDYLTNIRMTKAQDLLKKGKGVRETSSAVGYLDSAYFSKVFSQKFNISPSIYKQTYEKN